MSITIPMGVENEVRFWEGRKEQDRSSDCDGQRELAAEYICTL